MLLSLRNLLGKKDKLLSLLLASAAEAQASVHALVGVCNDCKAAKPAQDLAYARVHDRSLTDQILQELYSTTVAVLDQEDIEELSEALYKIPKLAGKFHERLGASPEFVRNVDFSLQLQYLTSAVDVLAELVDSLQEGVELERVKKLNEALQRIEGEADKHMLTLYKVLYAGRYSVDEVIVLKDLFELLEKIVDRTRDAGNIIVRIALKIC